MSRLIKPAAPALILPSRKLERCTSDQSWGMVQSAVMQVLAASGAGGAATTTLNPADKTTNAALSLGNLKLAPSGGSPSTRKFARSVAFKTAGDYYFEATFSNSSLSSGIFLAVSDGSPLTETSGDPFTNVAGFQRGASGTHGFAFKIGSKLWWWRDTSGVWTGDPVAGTGGTSWSWSGNVYVLAGILGSDPTDSGIWNFGATPFAWSQPSGFNTVG